MGKMKLGFRVGDGVHSAGRAAVLDWRCASLAATALFGTNGCYWQHEITLNENFVNEHFAQ